MPNHYVEKFLKLRSSGDILNVVHPVNKMQKEITESMAIIKQLKKVVLKEPMKYTVYDLCAGNALTSVISTFLLPIKKAIAIDILPRKRKWFLAENFEYQTENIYSIDPSTFDENSIIIGVHTCTSLANRIIELYQKSKAKHLILMPCCVGQVVNDYPQIVREKLGKYLLWSWQLSQKANGKFIVDEKMMSPKNAIVIAHKKGETK